MSNKIVTACEFSKYSFNPEEKIELQCFYNSKWVAHINKTGKVCFCDNITLEEAKEAIKIILRDLQNDTTNDISIELLRKPEGARNE